MQSLCWGAGLQSLVGLAGLGRTESDLPVPLREHTLKVFLVASDGRFS